MTDLKRFTEEELASHDGSGEEPALVAVDGKVYDVSGSKLWPRGKHMNAHPSGQDLTREIQAAPHGTDVLDRVELVGEIAAPEAEPESESGPPGIVDAILARHPHPVSVHFPIALSIAGALFMLAGMILGIETLEKAGFYNVIFAAVASPPAIGAGLLSWWYNYGHASTSIFRRKIVLSVVYVVVAGAAVALYVVLPHTGVMQWIPAALMALLAPLAMGLGYLGGKITFPS